MPLPEDGPDLPESRFVVAETLVRFDHGSGTAEVLAGDPDAIAARLDERACVQNTIPPRAAQPCGARPTRPRTKRASRGSGSTSGPATRSRSCSRSAPSAGRPPRRSQLYRALRRVNPSPYLFLLELDGLALVGSSPETLVKCEDGRASLNPIAGTTEPGEGDAERLLASEKDRAEHVMLVDLGRNDLSRVCRPGTVRVERFLEPERFSHVTHLVSEVDGELQDGRDAVRPPARDCFPAGTVSGAPKVRAMQIISELEGYRRGPYAGAVGYVAARAGRSTRASRSGRSSSTTASRGSRRARGSWQTPTRPPSTGSA